jgi:hypothetical protein
MVPDDPSSDGPSGPPSRGGLGAYVDAGVGVVDDHPWLALVPLVSALLSFGEARGAADTTVSVTFPLPSPVVDVWLFVQSGPVSAGTGGGPGALALVALVLLVGAVVEAALATVLLTGVTHALAGRRPEPFDRFGDRFPPLLGYAFLSAAVVLALAPLAALGPLALLVAFPVLLGLKYLFFGAPFLVVSEDVSLLVALQRSYELALDRGRYARFAGAFLLVGAVASVPVSLLVGTGLVGAALAALVVAPVGVVAVAATMAMVRDCLDRSGPAGDGHGGGPAAPGAGD